MRSDSRLSVHDGDIKAGATPCTDAIFEERTASFRRSSTHSFMFSVIMNGAIAVTVKTNRYDPEERLRKLREIFTKDKPHPRAAQFRARAPE